MKINNILLTIVLLLIIVILYWLYKSEAKKADRWEENSVALGELREDVSKVINLKLSEFKKYIPGTIDSILKESDIKKKQVNNITHVHNTYNYKDTAITIVEVEKKDSSVYSFENKNECMTIRGYVDLSRKYPRIFLTERRLTDNIYIIDYWKRRKWKFLFFNTRFLGKKENTWKIKSECGGEVDAIMYKIKDNE